MRQTPILVALLAALGGTVSAGTYDAAATGHGTSASTQVPVADGFVLIHVVTDYERFETADAGHPMAGLSGPCFGAVMVREGAVSGGGTCHYTDPAGGSAVLAWTPDGMSEGGRMLGTWSIVGGTGRWAEATGEGRFDAGLDAAGAYTNLVTGELTLP